MIRIFTMCIALFLICCSTNLKAASSDSTFKNQYTLYINQPIGFATKVRLTLENRFTKNSALLVNYTVFYGMYPGQHGYLEYRRYFSLSEGMEIAPYLKVGGGHSFQTAGSYGFGGIGVVHRIKTRKQIPKQMGAAPDGVSIVNKINLYFYGVRVGKILKPQSVLEFLSTDQPVGESRICTSLLPKMIFSEGKSQALPFGTPGSQIVCVGF